LLVSLFFRPTPHRDLSSNSITGSIPSSITSLTQLVFLNIGGNLLDGSIPDSLDSMVVLMNLNMSGNHLKGSIPTTLGSMGSLKFLYMNDNQLTGSIPGFINPMNLTELYVHVCILLFHKHDLKGRHASALLQVKQQS
ncbi:hypothetical protein CLOP_g13199, partial [Closterium sp. NIES-67]